MEQSESISGNDLGLPTPLEIGDGLLDKPVKLPLGGGIHGGYLVRNPVQIFVDVGMAAFLMGILPLVRLNLF